MSSKTTPSKTTNIKSEAPKTDTSQPPKRNWVLIGGIGFVVALSVAAILYFTIFNKSDSNVPPPGSGSNTDANQVQNGEWGPWDTECFQDSTDQLWKKRRTCVKEPVNGGVPCSELDGGDSIRVCDTLAGGWDYPEFPLDSDEVCMLKMDAQGKAIKDGQGREMWVKTRKCNNPAPRNGGAGCVGEAEQQCNPVNGTWSEYSACVQQLDSEGKVMKDAQGREIWNKSRTCSGSKYGGKCSGDAVTRCDPVDNVWISPPDSDAVCIEEKDANGKSVWMKTRTCSNTQYGGICPGNAKIACTPVDGVWKSVPDSDDVCKVKKDSNGRDVYFKEKICTGTKYGGVCPGSSSEPCNAINGQWSGSIDEAPCVITTTTYAPSYPRESLTSNNSAGCKTSASSEFLGEAAWKAFDGNVSTFWHSDLLYDPATGKYVGKTKTLGYENDPSLNRDISGEWIQIELPIKILPQSLMIVPRQDNNTATIRSPVDFALLASNDGNSWRIIGLRGAEMWTNNNAKYFDFSSIAKRPLYDLYSIYRLVVNNVGVNGNSVQISEMRIIPESPYYQSIQCTPPKYGGFGCPVLASKNKIGNTIEVDPLDSSKLRSQCARPNTKIQYNSSLSSGRRLSVGDSIVNGDYSLVLQQDGNLILLYQKLQMIWQSGSNASGNENCRAEMQADGNFVIYDQNNRALWASATSGAGNRVVLETDGALSISSSTGAYVKMLYERTFTVINSVDNNSQISTIGKKSNLLDPRFQYYIVGSWVTGSLAVTAARQLPDGRIVYMGTQGGHVKMVTNTGEARYFPPTQDPTGNLARVENFDPNAWVTYTNAGDNYKLRLCDSNCVNGCNPDGKCPPVWYAFDNTYITDSEVIERKQGQSVQSCEQMCLNNASCAAFISIGPGLSTNGECSLIAADKIPNLYQRYGSMAPFNPTARKTYVHINRAGSYLNKAIGKPVSQSS